jgi:3-methyladenine DNA glycosylase AlkD
MEAADVTALRVRNGETPGADHALIEALREVLRARADPAKAEPMRAYMKSAMPYLGVQQAGQRAACREVLPAATLTTYEAWRDTLLALWRTARYREEWYVGMTLAGDRRYARYQTLETLPVYQELIVSGAWWDVVDALASHRVGGLLRAHGDPVKEEMREWARDSNLWLRRAAILCQLGSKDRTDTALLRDCIEPNLVDKDFFMRKGTGWALREYAKTDPEWVRGFIREHAARLSPLSVREATKHIGPDAPATS